ncbi:MAG: triose-phosphate isomerase [Candidatus Liptonbacteria bacterium RIFCSPLOWO2_01_FULL_52_25]|uniref:Triosephosphate isomerase n=1 Tax=Candidatus Liptonbacteria bacterium RIFCSPLOWO2_01_FULL_52_25 TaxID=1798650 RepID=A0A1G2CHR1_9BACT|nr:MAG: triose-phosphate isomerase [Candidatus Liptonbacteria bacterium RIFCSPLOWO2_01_FULL_52_25]
MKKLIVANWKMNVPLLKSWRGFRAPRGVEVVVCPPFPYLSRFALHASRFKIGAQDVFWEEKGAFTGEVSSTMLKGVGVEYVIIGHSERRKWLCETDEMVNKKLIAALRAGLKVILCVGESLSVRKKGIAAAKRFVRSQLQKDLARVSRFTLHASRLVIAYEPIWAISGGHYGHPTDDPKDSAEMARFIKGIVRSTLHAPRSTIRVLYGGSVNSKNVKSFLHYKEIDGALVGGASLDAKEFRKMIEIASQSSRIG